LHAVIAHIVTTGAWKEFATSVNHAFACNHILWGRMAEAAIITTVSRYMIVLL
jgi:hypothetical protein